MKLSELIEQLTEQLKEHGDHDVCIQHEGWAYATSNVIDFMNVDNRGIVYDDKTPNCILLNTDF
jgi:hypothetical protein